MDWVETAYLVHFLEFGLPLSAISSLKADSRQRTAGS